MKLNQVIAIVLQIPAYMVSAHYTLTRLIVNGTISKDYQYTRKTTQFRMPFYVVDKTNTDLRCSYGALTYDPEVQTATVLAGESIGIGTESKDFPGVTYELGMYHGGPAQAYLSKLPFGDDLAAYKGDGEWFKIGEYGYLDQNRWAINGFSEPHYIFMNFTIPKTTPPGKYLMRAEQMYMLSPGFNGTQFFIGCAHVEVLGEGGGTPGPLVKFPETYDPDDLSIAVPVERAARPNEGRDLRGYKNPGPTVWSG